ncbi:cadherin-3-like [Protopterus annectens]|uniref:cadherin-3-like n=1 Tax=Protopterus annectens TaxID=7888 RepID=UPI001CFC3E5C|nr:cadherin-3-like [Protopterus annectens]
MWVASVGYLLPLCAVVLLFTLQFCRVCCVDVPTNVSCRPGFSSSSYRFHVKSTPLSHSTVLGKVNFSDCSGKTDAFYETDVAHILVASDGTLVVNRQMKHHNQVKSFTVHAWDSEGKKFSTNITLVDHGRRLLYSRGHVHSGHHNTELESPKISSLPVLTFPKFNSGLSRHKRAWVIPPMNVAENLRGPFPLQLVQIKSSRDKEITVFYSITGQGADRPPLGIFTIKREDGWVSVTVPLDREEYADYTLKCYAVSQNGESVEEPMDIIIRVIDQNDNRPRFTQKVFEGSVLEGVPPVLQLLPHRLDMENMGFCHMKYTTSTCQNFMQSVNKYTLTIQVADMEGEGLSATSTAIITIKDQNDNPPLFISKTYTANVTENVVDFEILQLSVTDKDEPHSPNWRAVYRIVKGNEGGFFNISTAESNNGILKVVKGLDYETTPVYTLLISAENEASFSIALTPSTATVTVFVLDQNEAPIFNPKEKTEQLREDHPVRRVISTYTATDPDKGQKQVIRYNISRDPAGWLEVNPETGVISSKAELDRESVFVQNNKYSAVILASDDGIPSATGTGTLILDLEDVNDNAPVPSPRDFEICNEEGVPVLLQIVDRDLPPHTSPFRAQLLRSSDKNWTVVLNEKVLLLLVILFMKRRKSVKEPLLPEDDVRDNIYYYDEEGGGEDDQDFDLSQLHRGLDARPEITRNDVVPTLMPAPQYRPRPANPDEIGNFIDENLNAADNDPTAPPYDSLLVFDYEGGDSEAGSLSSLNSSSSGDQDYDCLNEWGPRFRKLADMYGGSED